MMKDVPGKGEHLRVVVYAPAAAEACVNDVRGEEGKVGAVLSAYVNTGERGVVPADGLFVAVGHDPNTSLFLEQLDHDVPGYLLTQPGSTATNIPGVFAAGDV